MKNTFPEKFVRGIANESYIENGIVTIEAFRFEPQNRPDQKHELSISWVDDDNAISLTLNQFSEKKGKLQFSGGVALLTLDDVAFHLQSIPFGIYNFERSPLENNKYHGNILLSNNASKQMKLMVQAGLALAAGSNIISQNSNNKRNCQKYE